MSKIFASRLLLLKLAALFLGLLFAAIALVFLFRSPPAVEIIPWPGGAPPPGGGLRSRLRSVLPMWYWRLKVSLLGPAKIVNIHSVLFLFKDSPQARDFLLSLGKVEFAGTNGLQAWVFDEKECKTVREHLQQQPGNELIAQPRVSTAHKIQSRISIGNMISVNGTQQMAGVVMDFSPRVHSTSTDLITILTLTEAVTNLLGVSSLDLSNSVIWIRTNLAVAARIQIPNGGGVFLLEAPHSLTNKNRFGVLISASRAQR